MANIDNKRVTGANPMDLIELCKGKTIWIQTHNFPDPDAISSAFAMQKLLEHFGMSSKLCHEGQIDKLSSVKLLERCGIEMNPYSEIVEEMKEEDMILLIDCQKNNGNTTDLVGDEQAVIDHHPTFTKVEYQYEDLQITGACASIIAHYYSILGVTPSVNVATALLYGMRMDTLQMSRGVTNFDVEMYSFLFDYADSDLLNSLETNNMEFGDLKAYGSAIDNIRSYGKVAFSYLDFKCPDALVAALSDFLLALAEIEVVVIYAKRDDGYKFSLRSEREDCHAGDLANMALAEWGNGGGHASMAGGFVLAERLPREKTYLYDRVQEHFVEVIKQNWPQILK